MQAWRKFISSISPLHCLDQAAVLIEKAVNGISFPSYIISLVLDQGILLMTIFSKQLWKEISQNIEEG
jgi:hypothetical protein